MGVMLLGIVVRDALLQVGQGRGKLPTMPQVRPLFTVGLQEERRVLHALGQLQELFPQFLCRLELRSAAIKPLQPCQRREALRTVPHLLAELSRRAVCLFRFWGCISLSASRERLRERVAA